MATSDDNQQGGEPAQKDEQASFDRYRGTAAAIVATAIVRLDQLPGQPGRDSTRMFYRCGEPAGPVHRLDSQPDPENWMRIDRLNRDDLYSLTVGLSREDSLRRRAANRARRARRYAAWEAENSQREKAVKEQRRSDAERELAAMPACSADFLRDLGNEISRGLKRTLNYESVNRQRERFHGFMLAAHAVPEILEAFAAVQKAVERADVVFDRTLHQEIVAKRRHEIAALDENFQRHLAVVATTGKPRKRDGDAAPAAGLRMVWSAPASAGGGGEP